MGTVSLATGWRLAANIYQISKYLVFISTKDEFKIEPRYAHKKNLNKSEKKHMEGQNWLMETILQSKSLKKQNVSNFNDLGWSVSKIRFFPPDLFKFFLCAYRGSILNLSLHKLIYKFIWFTSMQPTCIIALRETISLFTTYFKRWSLSRFSGID